MIESSVFTLPNGLRVAHSCDPSTAMVAVNLLYDTGARDESAQHTGLAHLFEHLMFGGSENVNDFSAEVEAAGGFDNAWTSNDFTNFYEVLPAQNVETAFWLESDRMLSPKLDEHTLQIQRQVVTEEFKQQCLNRPFGDMGHHLRDLLYGGTHPYSWPVIGKEIGHVEKTTLSDARHWFFSHYGPDNAVLAVVGNVSYQKVFDLAHKWFGPIPSRNIKPRNIPAPKFPSTNTVKHVYGNVPQTAICMAFPMSAYGTDDYFAADTISDILSAGRSSRFHQNLMMGTSGLFSELDASISGSEHEGFLIFNAKINQSTDEAAETAMKLMLAQARELAKPGNVSDYELHRSLNRFESTFRFTNLGYQNRASNLAQAVMHNEDMNQTVERQRRISVADIQRVASKMFCETPHATIIYSPSK